MAAIKFFGRKDPLWGGETLRCTGPLSRRAFRKLGIKRKDQFRIERGPKSVFTLIPNPKNQGSWKETYNKLNPVKVSPKNHTPRRFKRAYRMMVAIKKNAPLRELFLIELENGSMAISSSAIHPPHGHKNDHDYAGVER